MVKLKRTLALLITGVMVMGLVACGGGSTGPKDTTAANSQTKETTGQATTAETQPAREMISTDSGMSIPKIELENKQVKFLGIDFPQFREDGVATEFIKKYYDGNIVVDVVAAADCYPKLASLVLSGDSPDVVMVNGGFPSLAVQDIIEPVDDVLDFNLDIMKDLKVSADQFLYNDKHYYLPWVSDALSFVYYNTKIFEDNGYETPRELWEKGQWDWNAFRDLAIKLNLDEDGDGNAERWGTAMCIWHDIRLAFSTGKNIIKINGTQIEPNLADPDVERAFNFMTDLTLKDKVADPNRDQNHVMDIFNQGKAAMLLGPDFWRGTDSAFKDLKKAKSMGWAPYPKDPNADKHYIAGESIGFYMPKGAKNKAGIEAFIYSSIAALKEQNKAGSPTYVKAKEKFMKKWSDTYSSEEYDSWTDYNDKINVIPQIVDSYRDLLDIDIIYPLMLGANNQAPLTYKQIVAQYEPVLKENITKAMNPSAAATPAPSN